MPEFIGLVIAAAIFVSGGIIAAARWLPRSEPKHQLDGAWVIQVETEAVQGRTLTRVVLVRSYRGRETGRVLVAEVVNGQGDWTNEILKAMTEAEQRLFTLQLIEGK